MPTATATCRGGRKGRHRHPRTTIQDVADALGLAKGTVSRALNDYPDISERTRLKVARKAAQLGYRPLAPAQAIRTGRTRSIGLVLSIDADDAQKPFLTDFLDGVSRAASAEHWTLTVATAASESDVLDTILRLIDERKADGFILPRTRVRDPRVDLCRRHAVPFVLYGRVADDRGCAWYDIRGEAAIRDAVLRLAGFGHRRIAFVNGGSQYACSRLRHEGFLAGMAKAGLPVQAELVLEGAMTREAGAQATRALLRSGLPPTAIVYALDAAAIGGIGAAAGLGLSVGRDISIIGYDGIPEGALVSPALTTFGVDTCAAGKRLAEILIESIRSGRPEELRELSDARLVVRQSDGPPSMAPARLAETIHKNLTTEEKDE